MGAYFAFIMLGFCLLGGADDVWLLLSNGYGSQEARPKSGEAILTNDQVIEMVKSGLKPEAITGQIRNSKNSFDFSTPEFIKLVKAGVPESVIAAMRDATGARSAPVPPSGGAWPSRPKGSMLKLTDGEKVRLILMDDLSSATANTGDRVNFSVAEDLKVGDVTVIAKGAVAYASVAEAKKKGMLGRGGKLTLSFNYVKAIDGQNIRIRATAGREGDDKTGKTVVVAVLAGPFALLVKGKDVEAKKGTEYTAFVDETKDIQIP